MGKRFSYRSSLDFLLNLQRAGIKLGLDRTVNLLKAIGDPQDHFRSVHVAGTNGKGSVAAYLNSILYHGGYRSGLFTSPHLVEYTERVRVDGEAISRADLKSIVSDIAEPILETEASFFEATTAVAFEEFRRKRVQVAAVEVGMGGRLDSTNVLKPELTAITSIDFDHVRYLGKTLGEIAGEKAGIIKPGVPVVTGELSKGARAAVGRVARSRGSKLYELGRHAGCSMLGMDIGGCYFEYRGLRGRRIFKTGMPGWHQLANASLALLLAELLEDRGIKIDDAAMERGVEAALWPGRLQVLSERPLIITDGAHNVAGARMLARSLEDMGVFPAITVFAVLRDKRYKDMLRHLAGISRRFIFTRPESDRALPVARLKEAARELGIRGSGVGRVDRAVESALGRLGKDDALLICGSLFAVGEAIHYMGFKPERVRLC
jgi:dihydrofolate synthase/folylpolyglutamate synthase